MKVWKLKGKGQAFRGSYEFPYIKKGKGLRERVFVLVGLKTQRRVTFESWQMAKKVGWKKV